MSGARRAVDPQESVRIAPAPPIVRGASADASGPGWAESTAAPQPERVAQRQRQRVEGPSSRGSNPFALTKSPRYPNLAEERVSEARQCPFESDPRHQGT